MTGKCAALAKAACTSASSFCTMTPTVCEAKSADCTAELEADCTAANGCLWDASGSGSCSDICSSVNTSDSDCTNTGGAGGCSVKTAYSCADNSSSGTTACGNAHNTSDCTTAATATGFCNGANAAGTCSSKDTYCTSKSDNTCDTTYCTFTPTNPFSCANAYDCTTLLANN